MLKNNVGVSINLCSGAGKVGFEDISVYCKSKFGMMGLSVVCYKLFFMFYATNDVEF